jgi:hypothetical protein
MNQKILTTFTRASVALFIVLGAVGQAQTPDAKALSSTMAPLDQYLMDRNAEIALARSAAPESLSHHANVMVLGQHGYETAIKGKNGFVCMVERGWTGNLGDPDFWNPKILGPVCFNPPAVRTYLPLTIKKTELALAGKSETQLADSVKAALDKKELPNLEAGAMCYMQSKQGYLSSIGGHWHPHLMFFVPLASAQTWGADLSDTPVAASEYPPDRLTIFMVLVPTWSDGSADSEHEHEH